MNKTNYHQKIIIEGPWSLGKEELKALHQVIVEIEHLLEQSWNSLKKLACYQEDRSKYLYLDEEEALSFTHSSMWRLVKEDGEELLGDNLLTLLNDESLKDQSIENLYGTVVYGDARNYFSLFIIGEGQGFLQSELECFDSSCRAEIEHLIENWIGQSKPNRITQLWSKYGTIAAFLLLMPFIDAILYLGSSFYQPFDEPEHYQVLIVSDDDISSQEAYNTMKTLLWYNSNYNTESHLRVNNNNDKNSSLGIVFSILIVILFILSAIAPRTYMSVNQGRKKLAIRGFDGG
ncbi:MAG: hypothetical protein AAF734_09410 [Bacteroidota bacterium]